MFPVVPVMFFIAKGSSSELHVTLCCPISLTSFSLKWCRIFPLLPWPWGFWRLFCGLSLSLGLSALSSWFDSCDVHLSRIRIWHVPTIPWALPCLLVRKGVPSQTVLFPSKPQEQPFLRGALVGTALAVCMLLVGCRCSQTPSVEKIGSMLPCYLYPNLYLYMCISSQRKSNMCLHTLLLYVWL